MSASLVANGTTTQWQHAVSVSLVRYSLYAALFPTEVAVSLGHLDTTVHMGIISSVPNKPIVFVYGLSGLLHADVSHVVDACLFRILPGWQVLKIQSPSEHNQLLRRNSKRHTTLVSKEATEISLGIVFDQLCVVTCCVKTHCPGATLRVTYRQLEEEWSF